MHDYQRRFIQFALDSDVLRFGEFTLKSGRRSPYFFNSGAFNDGARLLQLGIFYMHAIEQSALDFDMVFGPAYKGIPLASAVAMAYAAEHKRVLPFCFDRKEAKDHGEGGLTFGAPLSGKVLIIDDVVTAGTSVNNAVQIIRGAGATVAGVAVALDRQERGADGGSAIRGLEQRHGLRVISVVTLDQLVQFLEEGGRAGADLGAIRRYREQYGAPGG